MENFRIWLPEDSLLHSQIHIFMPVLVKIGEEEVTKMTERTPYKNHQLPVPLV